MFRKARLSIRKYKDALLRQEEQLRRQSELLEAITARLSALEGAPPRCAAGLPADFDPTVYLLLNPDLAAAGLDPTRHFLDHGRREGRVYRFGYAQDGLFTIHNSDFRQSPDFMRAYARGLAANEQREFNWHWRVHVGLWAARVAVRLPGDFIECGVNRGFLSSAIMCDLDWNALDRTFWLLDTFSGFDVSGVSSEDRDPGAPERNERRLKAGNYTTDVDRVRRNFSEWKNVEIVVGAVPATLAQVRSERIAFASIDMNTAPPEVAALEFLWPRLVPGAMVLLDDYAYFGYLPQKHAMDDFAVRQGTSVLSLPTGQGLIVRPPV